MGQLTTHVLDTAHGCPAAYLALELWQCDRPSGAKTLLLQTQTNADGRTDVPLLTTDTVQVGLYELWFEVGAYFRQRTLDLPEPPFLERVPILFGIADATQHYHVPLLVSPWSYSTYRGS
ncbi:MAG: hydroxyisourate hydrolase [Thermosynechococcaceae cyanobacterium]